MYGINGKPRMRPDCCAKSQSPQASWFLIFKKKRSTSRVTPQYRLSDKEWHVCVVLPKAHCQVVLPPKLAPMHTQMPRPEVQLTSLPYLGPF